MLLYLLLFIIIITSAVAIIMLIFNHQKNKTFRSIIAIGIAISIILSAFCGILGSIYRDNVESLKINYKDLTLYNTTISNTTNEYVRFDYYNRVIDYNTSLEQNEKMSSGKWLGWLYPEDWNSEISFVDFQLRENY